jgi:putative redox protein
VHGDDDTAAGAKAENPAFPRRGSRSYHHGGDGGRDSFERSIRLEGKLGDEARAQLIEAANMCPVGRTLGLSADICTNDNVGVGPAASYDDDLGELPIPYIDPD